MKILLVSDSHGDYEKQLKSLEGEKFDMLIHLGDYVEDGEEIAKSLALPRIIIRGNGDYKSDYKSEELIEINGKKLFLTHGHLYNIKYGIDRLYYRTKELGADICLFGHTHLASHLSQDDIIFLNPGSPSFPRLKSYYVNSEKKLTYGLITINSQIEAKIIEL